MVRLKDEKPAPTLSEHILYVLSGFVLWLFDHPRLYYWLRSSWLVIIYALAAVLFLIFGNTDNQQSSPPPKVSISPEVLRIGLIVLGALGALFVLWALGRLFLGLIGRIKLSGGAVAWIVAQLITIAATAVGVVIGHLWK